MIKKLTKHGNSYALVIDKPILELLGIEPDTPIEIATDGRMLILCPKRDDEHQRKVQEALGEVNHEFDQALERLAD